MKSIFEKWFFGTIVSFTLATHPVVHDATFPYDPPQGIYGFYRWLEDERYDMRALVRIVESEGVRPRQKMVRMFAKVYMTDLHGMSGFLLAVTDARVNIVAFDLSAPHVRPMQLIEMDSHDGRKVVYVNDASGGHKYGKLLILLISPNESARFGFYLMGFSD